MKDLQEFLPRDKFYGEVGKPQGVKLSLTSDNPGDADEIRELARRVAFDKDIFNKVDDEAIVIKKIMDKYPVDNKAAKWMYRRACQLRGNDLGWTGKTTDAVSKRESVEVVEEGKSKDAKKEVKKPKKVREMTMDFQVAAYEVSQKVSDREVTEEQLDKIVAAVAAKYVKAGLILTKNQAQFEKEIKTSYKASLPKKKVKEAEDLPTKVDYQEIKDFVKDLISEDSRLEDYEKAMLEALWNDGSPIESTLDWIQGASIDEILTWAKEEDSEEEVEESAQDIEDNGKEINEEDMVYEEEQGEEQENGAAPKTEAVVSKEAQEKLEEWSFHSDAEKPLQETTSGKHGKSTLDELWLRD